MSGAKKNSFFKFLSQNNHTPNNKHKEPNPNIVEIFKDVSSGGRRVEETYSMLELAVEQSIDGIAMADISGTIKFCNQAWANMHGYQIYELLGKNLSIFHTGKQMEEDVIPFNEQVIKTGAHSGEVGHLKKDGTIFLTRMTTTLLRDEKGKPLGFVGIGKDITEHRRTKEALVASEEKYRKLFEESIEGIGIFKGDNFITVNKALLNIFGYETLEEFLRIPITYHLALECRKMFRDKMVRWQVGEALDSQFEYKIFRRDGQVRDIEASTTEIVIKDEKYIQGTFRDITKRKLAEEELQKNEEKYKTLTENISVGLYRNTSGAKGRFIEANPAMVRMFGYQSKDEFLDIRVCDIYMHPQDRRKLSKKLSDNDFIKNEELSLKRKDGTEFIGSVSAVAVKDKKGKVKYFDGIVEDVTEGKKLEEKEKSTSDQLKKLISSVPIAIYTARTYGDYGATNITENIKELTGYESSIFTRNSSFWIDHIHPDDVQFVLDEVQKVFKKETHTYEYRFLCKDGKYIWVQDEMKLIRDEKGSPVEIVGYWADITDRKKAEERRNTITTGLRAVVEIADKLIGCPDLDSLFLRAVELAREKLGLERCAIFVENNGWVQGFYGTDRYGRTTDEHELRFEKNENWAKHLKKLGPNDPKWILVEEPRLEWDGQKMIEIDRGWIALTPIQSAHRPVGVFVNDSAISKSEHDEVKQDTLAVFCSLLGNIAERKRAEKELAVSNKELFKSNKRFKQLAFRDSHTGLYNHRYLQQAIESEFSRAQRYNYPFSVIMLDLDYFKSINDAYSHHFGDLVLKQFARQIKKMVRKYDIVIRFGGEEFLIISPGIDRSAALDLSQKILDVITSTNFGNNVYNVKLKLSIAVASYPENKVGRGIDLIELVDKILNKAKEDGGNRVYSFADIKLNSNILEENEDQVVKFLRTKINRLHKRANQSLIESVFAFARTIKLKDQYTGEHVENTMYYATEIANKLGMSKSEIENVKRASMLHDLGKIGISEKILLKKSSLSDKEFAHIKKHPQIGADILRPIQSLHSIIPLVLYHHERWDGMGYPRGLKKEEIPLGARIVAIADVYQALVSDRPYRKALPKNRAKEIIKDGSGSQFDPSIAGLFLKVID